MQPVVTRTVPSVFAAVGMFLGVSSSAQAGTLIYEFKGVVTAIADDSGTLGDRIRLGDQVTSRWMFDANAVDMVPDNANVGRYGASGGTIEFGPFSFTVPSDQAKLEVVNADGSLSFRDKLSLYTGVLGDSGGLQFSSAEYILAASGTGLIADDRLPVVPWPLTGLEYAFFRTSGTDPSVGMQVPFKFSANITSFTIVPEPGTVTIALAGLLFLRRCRASRLGAPGLYRSA